MPLVKPTTTGRGMNFTAVPMPVTPSTHEHDARHHRAHEQAGHAVRPTMMPATTTTNAPVGPPIWVRDPPSAEIRKPVTIAQ